MEKIVKLNVGGKLFATFMSTLTRINDTFFTAYFSDAFNHETDFLDGSYMIDRPPDYFGLILNYMRGIDIKHNIYAMNTEQITDFIEEVVFYQVHPIFDILNAEGSRILFKKYGVYKRHEVKFEYIAHQVSGTVGDTRVVLSHENNQDSDDCSSWTSASMTRYCKFKSHTKFRDFKFSVAIECDDSVFYIEINPKGFTTSHAPDLHISYLTNSDITQDCIFEILIDDDWLYFLIGGKCVMNHDVKGCLFFTPKFNSSHGSIRLELLND